MPEIAPVIRVEDLDGTNGYAIFGTAEGGDFDLFGLTSGGGSDINGDGIPDIVGGALAANSISGVGYVVFGGAQQFAALDAADGTIDGRILVSELDGTNGFTVVGQTAGARFGMASAGIGDVDGDGFDDVLFGARSAGGNNNSGTAHLVFGGSAFNPNVSAALDGYDGFVFNGVGTNSLDDTGRSVAGLGDINGDGFEDFIIGATGADPVSGATNTSEGAAYVVLGGLANLQALDAADGFSNGSIELSNLAAGKGFIIAGETLNASAGAGFSVAGAGDVNGDGFDDVLVGAPNADPRSAGANEGEGAAYLVFGSANIGDETIISGSSANGYQTVEFYGVAAFDRTGIAVNTAGDINGDGYADIIIGASGADNDLSNGAGAAYVVFGRSAMPDRVDLGTLDGTNGFTVRGMRSFDEAGYFVSSVGDVNGDGFDDVAIGARGFQGEAGDISGALFVVFGKAGGFDAEIDLGQLDGTNGFRVEGPVGENARLGWGIVREGGDFNGDGFDDIVVGAPYADGNGFNAGAVYVIYGQMAQGSVTRVGSDLGQTQNGGIGDDTILGNDGDDVLIAHAGNDMLYGGADNDILRGGTGDDVLDGGSGFDIASYIDVGGAVNVNLGTQRSVENTLAGGLDTLISIEGIIGSNFADSLFGDDNDNSIYGERGADRIGAGGGDDFVNGGFGADTIYGNSGNDTIFGESNNDFIGGNDGDDHLFGNRGADNIRGGNGNDLIRGDDQDDRLYGDGGADTIFGGAGNDFILGGDGIDTINGGFDNDLIRGQDGNDNLAGALGDDDIGGGNGNDRIRGGAGNDILAGNAGADTFVFDAALGATNVDTILDMVVGEDTIELDLDIFTTITGGGALSANQFRTSTGANTSDQRIIYTASTGELFYDADGSGGGAQVLIAILSPGLALSASDFTLAGAQEPLQGKLPEILTADPLML